MKTIRTALVMLATVLAALTLQAVPAAADYEAPSVRAQALADGRVSITGEGCQANERVDYQVTADEGPPPATPSGTATADTGGSFAFTLDLEPGEYTVTTTCGDLVQVLGVTVAADAAGATDAAVLAGTEQAGSRPTDVTVLGATEGRGPTGDPLPKDGGGPFGIYGWHTSDELGPLAPVAAILFGTGALFAYARRKRRVRVA